MICVLFYFLLFVSTNVESSRILGIFHEKSFSHQQLGTKLLFALANKDHDVTMLTTVVPKFPPKNLTVIELDLQGHATGFGINLFEINNLNLFEFLSEVNSVELQWTEAVLQNSNVQKLLLANERFDVVIMEQLGNHALKGFCHYYNAHCIMLSTMGSTPLTDEQMGNPYNPSYTTYRFLNYPPEMNFYQRLHNSFVSLVTSLYFHFISLPQHDTLMHKYFPNAPNLKDLMYNVSLMLVNSHYSNSAPVANLPNVIEIGGFHIDPPKELPIDIKEYLDSATDGAIYFSMGSILKSNLMQQDKLKSILNAFSKLKQKVLWKFEDDSLNLPINVKIVKWLSQTDVLAHSNVCLFVTHGGLLSTTEAIKFGVPIVGIPIFADQRLNVALAEYWGYGVSLPYSTLDEDNFGNALNLVLNNKTFKDVASQKSKVFHDRPMSPLDKALFWIEYCIRHNGATHLRSSALSLRWYQYLLLDVVLLPLLSLAVIVITIWALIKNIICQKKRKTKME